MPDEYAVLVTGGAGFTGSHFVRMVLRERPSWWIVVLDKLTYAGRVENLGEIGSLDEEGAGGPSGHLRFVHGDICDRDLVDRLISGESTQAPRRPIDAIVNFAAESHVDRSISDAAPFIETNVKGTQVLLETARRHWPAEASARGGGGGRRVFLQIGTDEVYGSIAEGRWNEDAPLAPNNPYAASKAAADLLCFAYHRTYRLPVVISRSSNIYGPYQHPEKLIPRLVHRCLIGDPLPVYGNGENVREWLYVDDVCRGLLGILERGGAGEVYHLGGGAERATLEIARAVQEAVAELVPEGRVPGIETVADRPGHDFRYALDGEKLRRLTGWAPETAFPEGLFRTVRWYAEHRDWIERSLAKGGSV